MSIKVSVVIPAYNVEAYVGEAVRSALQQADVSEVIVVDDGSQDATADRAAEAGALVLSGRVGGAAAARNRGVLHAREAVVAFLDADDVWLPDSLRKRLAILEAEPGLAGVFSRMNIADEHGNALGRAHLGRAGMIQFEELLIEDVVPTCTVVLRKEALEECEGFDESLPQGADHDLWLRLVLRYPNGLRGVDSVDAVYRRRSGQLTANVERFLDAWHRILLKMELLRPEAVERVRDRANANAYRVASVSAYEAADSGTALSLLLKAIGFAPLWTLSDTRTWWQLGAVVSACLIPRRWHQALEHYMRERRTIH